jgi:hypothetical protein
MSSLRDFIDEGPVGKRRLPILAAPVDVDDEEDEDEDEEIFDDTEADDAPMAAANDESPAAASELAQDGAE